MDNPHESISDLDYESSLPLLRSHHTATTIEAQVTSGLTAANEVVLLGGTLRHPILVSFASKGILPYRGLGSGIKRALGDT